MIDMARGQMPGKRTERKDGSHARNEVLSVVGLVDEILITEIIAPGATPGELNQAWAWVNNDKALMNEGRPLPSGR